MLIVEEYLLLIHDESGRRLVDTTYLEALAAAGLLLELSLLERVAIDDAREWGRRGRVVVCDGAPTGNMLLDEALAVVAARPRKPQSLIDPIARAKPARRALDHLAATGVLEPVHERVLGMFPTTRWLVQHAEETTSIRTRLGDVLFGAAAPDVRTGALIALLSAQGQTSKVIGPPEAGFVRRRDIDRAARQYLGGYWAADALRRYVEEQSTAAMTAVNTATTI